MYKPNPIDTSDIEIDNSILELSELMAKNTHEVWAKGRMDEGWCYGTEIDDKFKIHPSLVSYEELSENEKSYDRRTSLETLKLIIKLGYKIEKVMEDNER